jgi:hypothetical protein
MKREIIWKGDRGEGSIFYLIDSISGERISPNLYLSYRADGQEQRVSAKTDDLEDAKQELRRLTRNRENAREGKEPLATPKTERVTIGELLDANLRRAEEKKLASARGIRYRTERLKAALGKLRALALRAEHLDAYRRQRRLEKVSDTSIRHELEILDGAFRYAVRRRVLAFAPFIEKPTEDKVREKEIPLEAFPRILAAIDCPDVRDFEEWLLLTAMRPKGTRELRWDWFDRKAWTLRIPSEKGGNAREFAIEGSLRRVIERRLASRRLDCPFIFQHRGRELKQDRTRRIFYAALKACELASGREGFTLYDTKKTAAGLLIDSGLSERDAMNFSGHKTPSMFDRYVIKFSERHRKNVRQRDAYLKKRLAETPLPNAEKLVDFLSKRDVR